MKIFFMFGVFVEIFRILKLSFFFEFVQFCYEGVGIWNCYYDIFFIEGWVIS